jgi:hypothetical protein
MKINHCMLCGTEQQLVNVDEFYCERCGAKNQSDGWCQMPDERESRDQQDFYDNGSEYRDRESYERRNRR